jgi:hypothetical protein
MTSGLNTAPNLGTQHSELHADRDGAGSPFWLSLVVSIGLFAVAFLMGGQALKFEEAASGPHYLQAP